MHKQTSFSILSLGVFLALGIAISGYFISQTIYNSKVAINTSVVKGLAEKNVISDRASWNFNFKVSSHDKNGVKQLYKKIENQQNRILDILHENGFSDKHISLGVVDYNKQEFRNKENIVVDQKIELTANISVNTDNVYVIKDLRNKIHKLVADGFDIEDYAGVRYTYTNLNDIKPQMLEDATKNARIAANEFAKNANVKVGNIRSAKQGNFTILDEGENYGATSKIKKQVRVVTTIEFYLTD